MEIVAKISILIVALEHFYILWLEMFAWKTRGPKVFRSIPKDLFEKTEMMAKNQGLYNGFLAVGLIWSCLIENVIWSKNIAIFFLSCVIVAAIYGAITVDKRIFFTQGIPAIIALFLTLFFL
ncbi:hypothetical protein UJ101_01868 [Flavobacteriaceae bacterium UJ101]|nr:hypothetical protein UJ101_01868 [Flavobacteriaceae bacterium UJ101]